MFLLYQKNEIEITNDLEEGVSQLIVAGMLAAVKGFKSDLGSPEERRLLAEDDAHRDPSEEIGESPLGHERFQERSLFQGRQNLRRNSSAKVNASKSHTGQSQASGYAAKHGDVETKGFDTEGLPLPERILTDSLCRVSLHHEFLEPGRFFKPARIPEP